LGLLAVIAVLVATTVSADAVQKTRQVEAAPPVGSSTVPLSAHSGAAVGPGISVDEAAHGTQRGPLLVNGYVVIVDGRQARLCTALTGKVPPRCVAPSLTIAGLHGSQRLAVAPRKVGKVRWSPESEQILGQVGRGAIRVGGNARA
jgi:hypothetical protein